MPKRKKDTHKSGGGGRKKTKGQPQANLTPLTPPSPSHSQPNSNPTSKTEAFPNEVYSSILSHLQHDPDKTTLARCMRVSKAFKLMAAQMLYEKLEWKDMLKDPLKLFGSRGVIQEGRQDIITKEDGLRCIKSIEIRSHDENICPCVGPYAWRGILAVPVLQVIVSTNEDTDTDDDDYKMECLEFRACPLFLKLAPRKVVAVFDGRNMGVELGSSIKAQQIDDYVVILAPQYEYLDVEVVGFPRRLIVVLSSGPSNYRSQRYDTVIQNSMSALADHLAYYGRLLPSLREVVMVNFDSLEAQYLDPAGRPSLESLCKKAVKSFEPIKWVIPSGKWRTAQDAAQVSYELISTAEYISNYDRKGEYSCEQVIQMIDG